jgi:hypothetical protein
MEGRRVGRDDQTGGCAWLPQRPVAGQDCRPVRVQSGPPSHPHPHRQVRGPLQACPIWAWRQGHAPDQGWPSLGLRGVPRLGRDGL